MGFVAYIACSIVVLAVGQASYGARLHRAAAVQLSSMRHGEITRVN
jgi:hypothetical protein